MAIPDSFHTDEPDITVLAGDVTSREDVDGLCNGADVVIHTAAAVREGGDPAVFQRVNVEGTRNVSESAKALA